MVDSALSGVAIFSTLGSSSFYLDSLHLSRRFFKNILSTYSRYYPLQTSLMDFTGYVIVVKPKEEKERRNFKFRNDHKNSTPTAKT